MDKKAGMLQDIPAFFTDPSPLLRGRFHSAKEIKEAG